MPSSSSQAPLPVLPPLRSVPFHSSKSSKKPVNSRSRARVETQTEASPPRRKASPTRSRSSSDSVCSSSSESSRSSSSSSSSGPLPSRSASYSSSSNYYSSTPSSPRNRSPLPPNRSGKPSVQKSPQRSSVRKRQDSGSTSRGKSSQHAGKVKPRVIENGSSRAVPLSVRNKTCASAAEIVGRSDATIAEALEQLAVLSNIPRRRGRPSKSVIEQRNRLQRLREQLDNDIDRLSTTNKKHATTATSAAASAATKTAKKSCKRPSGSMSKADALQSTESSDRVAKRTKRTSSTTKTTTVTYIESSSSSSEDSEVKPVARKRQRSPSSDENLDSRKTKRLANGISAKRKTTGSLVNKGLGASPRKRAEKAPKTSICKPSAEKEKLERWASRNKEDEENSVESDDEDESENAVDDSDVEEEDGDVMRDDENDDGKREKRGGKSSYRETEQKDEKDEKDEKIERMLNELDDLKDRLQKEIYRAAELEEALGLDIKAQVASAAEVQSMKSRIAELEKQVKGLQSTIERNVDQVREKDAALRGLLAQVKELEGRQCEKCSMKSSDDLVQKEEEKKKWKTEVEGDVEKEEVEELKRYANEVSARLKRVLQVNRRMQQKMFRLRRGDVVDKEVHDSI